MGCSRRMRDRARREGPRGGLRRRAGSQRRQVRVPVEGRGRPGVGVCASVHWRASVSGCRGTASLLRGDDSRQAWGVPRRRQPVSVPVRSRSPVVGAFGPRDRHGGRRLPARLPEMREPSLRVAAHRETRLHAHQMCGYSAPTCSECGSGFVLVERGKASCTNPTCDAAANVCPGAGASASRDRPASQAACRAWRSRALASWSRSWRTSARAFAANPESRQWVAMPRSVITKSA